jgi:hypothetical protein
MSTKQEVTKLGKHLEEVTDCVYGLTTYSPGDGVTYYKIGTGYKVDTPNLAPGVLHDYFGDRTIVTAHGPAEALVMLRAFLAGRDSVAR